MFTKGQWIFGILFFIAFVIVITYTYRKDLKLHRRYYKGSIWVLLAFISFILFIALLKFIFK
ncbi:MAG: hypothetical protein P8X62_09850 [Flavobacteriaceae bacterium]